ncbi:helix-turn-helix domain-containing protein [Mycobacterium sp. P7213]|uniref:helix-turn-helix domain-containing protein n=1 Tax=Mycobacterium sp. P7213 TaxID=2478465 RepID=UPI000F62AA62|nr:helix-turn-helix domain-containing protein [Mycobacterium sp. P7213]
MPAITQSPAVVTRRMTPDDVADVLGYSQTSTVWRLIREEGLPAVRFNRRYYINEADLHAWMAERGLITAAAPRPAPAVAANTAPSGAVAVDPAWVADQVAKFDAEALRRAGELLLALANSATAAAEGGAA